MRGWILTQAQRGSAQPYDLSGSIAAHAEKY
jgi:hypothetical protein